MNFSEYLINTEDGFTFDGPLLLKPKVLKDNRGEFFESWNFEYFNKIMNKKILFVQDNISFSHEGVLRGLHYQLEPFSQGKLITCLSGKIFDVIVDIRKNSETFGKYGSINLSFENNNILWIPKGFAHGFLSLSPNTILSYKLTSFWEKKSERSLFWEDKTINIKWPLKENNIINPIISFKDKNAKSLFKLIKDGDLF